MFTELTPSLRALAASPEDITEEHLGHAALIRSHKNGLQPLGSTTETMPPNHKTITAAAMTSRITSSRELLHY